MITCGIPTKDRYDTLVLTLMGAANQTSRPRHVIIVDDTNEPVDLRTLPAYQEVFELFNLKGITFQVIFGQKKGQHLSHQTIQEVATTDWVWRLDDDQIPEPGTLETLCRNINNDAGAIGGLVLQPGAPEVPPGTTSVISDPNQNIQWFRHPRPMVYDVDHLHATFMYRRGIEKFNPFLSPAAHREETLFSYGIKRKGYRVLVDTSATTWHFPGRTGGIRSHVTSPQYWQQDEEIFKDKLSEWDLRDNTKYIVLDCGRGDHVIVKSLLPRIKKRYPNLVLATCFRDIFDGENQISIAEAKHRLGNIDGFNVYRWAIDHRWEGSLVDAYWKMFGL